MKALRQEVVFLAFLHFPHPKAGFRIRFFQRRCRLEWRFPLFFLSSYKRQPAPKLQTLIRKQAFEFGSSSAGAGLNGAFRFSLSHANRFRHVFLLYL